MSLARTALRLQAIEALNADPVVDFFVQGRIYDSRIADFDHREPVPVMVLTTEEDEAEAWSKNNGGAPFNHVCDLVIEIAMNAVSGQGDEMALNYVGTDRELEAMLDLLEERAVEAITAGETPQAYLLRTAVTRRVPKMKSSRFATDQTGEKLAIRLLTLRVELKGEDQRDVRDVPAGPFAQLPEPLRTVAAGLPEGSGRQTCVKLNAALSAEPRIPFLGADITHAPQPFDPDIAPDRAHDIATGATVGDRVAIPDWSA